MTGYRGQGGTRFERRSLGHRLPTKFNVRSDLEGYSLSRLSMGQATERLARYSPWGIPHLHFDMRISRLLPSRATCALFLLRCQLLRDLCDVLALKARDRQFILGRLP